MEKESHSKMGILIVVVVALLTILFFYKRRSKPKGKYINDSLSYLKWTPVRLPVIDGLIGLWVFRNVGIRAMEQIPVRYPKLGKTFKVNAYFFAANAIITSDVKIIQKVLSSTSLTHLNKPEIIYQYIFSEFLNGGLVSSHTSIWEPHRKAVLPAFSYKAFPTYLEFMTEASLEMANSACKLAEWKPGKIIENLEVRKFIDLAAVQIITNIIMGSNRFGVPKEELAHFHMWFHKLKEVHLARFLRPELFIPFIWNLHPNSKIFQKGLVECRTFINMIIEKYRHEKDRDKISRKTSVGERVIELDTSTAEADKDYGIKPATCLIEHMLNSEMTNKEIQDEVATFMTAGHETTVNAIDMLLFHLAKHTEYQKQCHEEIDRVFNLLDESGKLTMEDMSQLKFLDRCIQESMRLTPTIPWFLRQIEEDLEIEEGRVLEAGTTVFLETWMTHRDTEFYPDPEKFDPDRWLPENVKLRPYHSYFPFSLGPRNCIGWKIAMMETKVIVAYILRHFEMTTTETLDDVKLLFELTLKPERMYDIKFKRRNVGIKAA